MITLLTDFGNDAYVGIMKGVIYRIHPQAAVADITHHIQPQAVSQASFIIKSACSYFPRGTVHCIVVDPGVGTKRNILIASLDSMTFLAPDNGVLTSVLDTEQNYQLYKLTESSFFPEHVSHTFHGRDIFAPVAACLDKGIHAEEMGIPVQDYLKLPSQNPVITSNGIQGQILFFDGFGNGITNIPESLLYNCRIHQISIGKTCLKGIHETYSDVEDSSPLVLINSYQHLEIAVRNGSAREQLNLQKGQTLEIQITKG